MRLAGAFSLIVAVATTTALGAGAPESSIRPKPRVGQVRFLPKRSNVKVFYRAEIRPKPRISHRGYQSITEVSAVDETVRPPVDTYVMATTIPVYKSPRPNRRPANLALVDATDHRQRSTTPRRVASTTPVPVSGAGKLCGDRRIQGEQIASIAGTLPGCGVSNPVRVASIDGVVLGQASIMDCNTAKALTTWITRSLKPAVGRRGGGVKSLSVPSHYSCRTRNSQPGAKISEHGKGHAIDISSINLKDGSKITVLDGWRARRDGPLLKKIHRKACGTFGTVLGPESNRFHKDHFHFDTARYRSGPFCE